MPTFAAAPPRVLSPDQVVAWLSQVANDGDLTPITNRAAIKLAGDFALGLPALEITTEQMAKVLGVSLNTAKRAVDQLTESGHLAVEKRSGWKTTFRPVLRGEVRS